ncbi:MAG: hypothetical protein IPJ19_10460 [Planctomycetes bacterium]|nr:hypothetical protein [Planctomycetota bacterium]
MRIRHHSHLLPRALAAALLCLGVACHSTPPALEPTRVEVAATVGVTEPEALLSEVRAFASRFQTTVAGTGSALATQTQDPVVRERTLQWRIQSIPAMHAASSESDPRIALANVWAMCARQRFLFESDPEHPLMGDQNAEAVRVAKQLEDAIIEIARKHIPDDKVALAREKIEEIARRENTALLFKTPIAAPGAQSSSNPLVQLLGLPLAPLQGMQGIGDTPAELHRLVEVGKEYAQLAQELPDILRWEAELLALSIDQLPTLRSVQDFAKTASALQASVDTLPQRLGSEVRTTLEGSQGTLESLRATTADTRAAAEALTTTMHSATEFVQAWKQAFPGAPAASPDPAVPATKPFEMGDVTSAARELSSTVGELRQLLGEVQAASKSDTLPALEQSANATMQQAAQRANEVVDRAFSRALILLVAFFVLLAATRLVRRAPR